MQYKVSGKGACISEESLDFFTVQRKLRLQNAAINCQQFQDLNNADLSSARRHPRVSETYNLRITIFANLNLSWSKLIQKTKHNGTMANTLKARTLTEKSSLVLQHPLQAIYIRLMLHELKILPSFSILQVFAPIPFFLFFFIFYFSFPVSNTNLLYRVGQKSIPILECFTNADYKSQNRKKIY